MLTPMDIATTDSFQTTVIEASRQRPVLVDFWGPRCGPCLKMMPSIEQLAESAADRATVVKVNTAENKRLAMSLRVMGLPTFALYRHGQEIERLTGDGCTPASARELIEKYASEPASA